MSHQKKKKKKKKIDCRICFSAGAKNKRSRNTNIHIYNFLSSQLSAPLATATVHICIYIYDSAKKKTSYFLLIEAAYQLLFPTRHKSRGLKDFKKRSF